MAQRTAAYGDGVTDWAPLGGNPAPGSPDAIDHQVAVFRTQAFLAASCAQQLSRARQRLDAVWRDSAGALAYGRALLSLNPSFAATQRALHANAAAMDDFAGVLRILQAQAASALATVSQARQRIGSTAEDLRHLEAALFNPVNQLTPFGVSMDSLNTRIHQQHAVISDAATVIAAAVMSANRIRLTFEIATDAAVTALASSSDALARWRTVGSAGYLGAPAEGPMAGSVAWRMYLGELATTRPVIPASPTAAANWWNALDPILQQDYLRNYPAVIGNANGLPAGVRDEGNRAQLAIDLASARSRCTAAGQPLPGVDVDPDGAAHGRISSCLEVAGYSAVQARAIQGSLEIDYQLHHRAGGYPALPDPVLQLLIYDPSAFDGAGRAAISIGDASTAANIVVTVPGMTSDVPDYLGDQLSEAGALYAVTATQASTAVIAYLGYHAPGIQVSVTNQRLADQGATLIAADLAGFDAMQAVHTHTTVIAHSYGTTAVATAFAQDGARADDLILIGSPGAGRAQTAKQLNMPDGHVWVGANSADPVTTIVQQAEDPAQLGDVENEAAQRYFGKNWVGPAILFEGSPLGQVTAWVQHDLHPDLGSDPAGAAFGAKRFHAENGSTDKFDFDNHSEYFEPDSESLGAMSAIAVGRGAEVPLAKGRTETDGHYQGSDPEADGH